MANREGNELPEDQLDSIDIVKDYVTTLEGNAVQMKERSVILDDVSDYPQFQDVKSLLGSIVIDLENSKTTTNFIPAFTFVSEQSYRNLLADLKRDMREISNSIEYLPEQSMICIITDRIDKKTFIEEIKTAVTKAQSLYTDITNRNEGNPIDIAEDIVLYTLVR